MKNIGYLTRRLLTLWRRTKPVSDFLARRLLFRFLSTVPVLSAKENVSPKPLVLDNNERVLILAPHADDESIGCGGLLASVPQQASVVCLTDGALADPHVTKQTLVALRKLELADAMAVVGIQDFRYLLAPDQGLINEYQRFSSLSLLSWDIIFLPNFLDQHPDHKAVTWLLQRLLREKPHKPTLKIAFYEVWGALPVWNAYIVLDEQTLTTKRRMIDCYPSQTKHINYAQRIEGLHTYRGITVDQPMVEAYLVLDVADFLAIA
jgi:LmbE family N-acetylglucosaminyl deacetylase